MPIPDELTINNEKILPNILTFQHPSTYFD
jgi:hypothetical protein